MTSNQLLTTGQIAAHTGWDRTTVHRKLTELDIAPVMTAGRTRLFAASVVDLIGARTDEAQS